MAAAAIEKAMSDPYESQDRCYKYSQKSGKLRTDYLIGICRENIEFAQISKLISYFCGAAEYYVDELAMRTQIISKNKEYIKNLIARRNAESKNN